MKNAIITVFCQIVSAIFTIIMLILSVILGIIGVIIGSILAIPQIFNKTYQGILDTINNNRGK